MLSAKKSIIAMTAYLVIYTILINTGLLLIMVPYLYIVSAFFIVWMAACILKDARVKYPKLKKNEE